MNSNNLFYQCIVLQLFKIQVAGQLDTLLFSHSSHLKQQKQWLHEPTIVLVRLSVSLMLTLSSVVILNRMFLLKGLNPQSSQLLIIVITNLKKSLVKTRTISYNKSAMKRSAQFIFFICVYMKIMGCKIKLHFSLNLFLTGSLQVMLGLIFFLTKVE